MAVNAFGDIVDPETGAIIAGPRTDNANEAPFQSTREILRAGRRRGTGGPSTAAHQHDYRRRSDGRAPQCRAGK